MHLFRADSGHGKVFKDIQVESELTKLSEKDREASESGCERSSGINFEDILCSTQHAHEGDRAVDISFGSVGYSLLLARKYCHVISIRFHPFYANENELFHIAAQCRIDTVTLPENLYAKERFSHHKTNKTSKDPLESLLDKDQEIINLIIVGPFYEEEKIQTVNLFLEELKERHFRKWGEWKCTLIYIRPVMIGLRSVDFCTFTPPSFFHKKKFLKQFNDNDDNSTIFSSTCHKTSCEFKATVFEHTVHSS